MSIRLTSVVSTYFYLLAVSRMKKTQGREGDQTTRSIGSLSTVPAHVISGRSFPVLCSRIDPSSDPISMNISSNGQNAIDRQVDIVSISGR